MIKALVLGATGFIGGHIAKKAYEQHWEISGFRRDDSSTGDLDDLNIHWISGDLEDYPSLLKAMGGMDYVFHAAAYYPGDGNPAKVEDHVKKAAQQMKNVIRAVREAGVKRLIYTSSLTTIGSPPEGADRLADERDFYQQGSQPSNGYYEVKSAMENLALEAARVGYQIVILNPTLVLGPGDIHLATGEIVLLIARGKALAVPPGTINVVDARDAAEAHIQAARIGRSGERYILGGSNYTTEEAVGIIAEMAGVKPPRFVLPPKLIDLYINTSDKLPFLPYPPDHLRAYKTWQGYNTEKARQELGLKTRFLEETARDSIKWFSDQGFL
ncbi:MAG: NAD-dependent epimerase/dehydratase family protein [Anaerolineales bacterium]